jgi:hypothetical protein
MPISFVLNIDEDSQLDSFQNATLHNPCLGVAASIAIYPHYPPSVSTQEDAKQYLAEHLAPLSALGWTLQVMIGRDSDTAEDDE